MRKLTVLLMVLASALLVAAPALAGYEYPLPPGLANEVTNGTFETGNFTGWINNNFLGTLIPGHTFFTVVGDNSNHYAQSVGYVKESSMYQIIDESQFNGWNANGTSKNWWFQFAYKSTDSAIAEAAAFYYRGVSATAPAFGGIDTPGPGWEPLYNNTSLANEACCTTVYACDTIDDFQPQWIAIGFEGIGTSSGAAAFDNIAFYGECESTFIIPVPPSVVLLGSGLLSLAIFRFKRANRHS